MSTVTDKVRYSTKNHFSFFGKTIENVRKRKDIRLITNPMQHARQVSKSNFIRFEIFDEDFTGVELVKQNLVLDRPIYLGATILELAKLKMYQFWYGVLKPAYPDIKLCFTGEIC